MTAPMSQAEMYNAQADLLRRTKEIVDEFDHANSDRRFDSFMRVVGPLGFVLASASAVAVGFTGNPFLGSAIAGLSMGGICILFKGRR